MSPGTILYLHGGGYCVGSPRTHRALTSRLARAAGFPVFAAEYRLAPEHPFPAALDDTVAACRSLMQSGPVVIAGDSAGGGLALATALYLRQRDIGSAAALILFSPWADLTLSALTDKAARKEVMLSTAWLGDCARPLSRGRERIDAARLADLRRSSRPAADVDPMRRRRASVQRCSCGCRMRWSLRASPRSVKPCRGSGIRSRFTPEFYRPPARPSSGPRALFRLRSRVDRRSAIYASRYSGEVVGDFCMGVKSCIEFIVNRRRLHLRRLFGRPASRPLRWPLLLGAGDQLLVKRAHHLVPNRALLGQPVLQTAQQRGDHSVRGRLGNPGLQNDLPVTTPGGRQGFRVMFRRQARDRLDDARDAGDGFPINLLLRWRRSHRRLASLKMVCRRFYCTR